MTLMALRVPGHGLREVSSIWIYLIIFWWLHASLWGGGHCFRSWRLLPPAEGPLLRSLDPGFLNVLLLLPCLLRFRHPYPYTTPKTTQKGKHQDIQISLSKNGTLPGLRNSTLYCYLLIVAFISTEHWKGKDLGGMGSGCRPRAVAKTLVGGNLLESEEAPRW